MHQVKRKLTQLFYRRGNGLDILRGHVPVDCDY
jgi:hypothetical protein